MEAGKYGLTRGTRLVARRLEVVAAVGMLWISSCVLGGARFFVFFTYSHFQIRRARAIIVDSVEGQRQPANLPTENSRPTDSHQVYDFLCSRLRIMAYVDQKSSSQPIQAASTESYLRPDESDFNNVSSFDSASRRCS